MTFLVVTRVVLPNLVVLVLVVLELGLILWEIVAVVVLFFQSVRYHMMECLHLEVAVFV